MLTARQPGTALANFCRRYGLVLVQISSKPGTHTPGGPATHEDASWIEVRLAGGAPPAGIRALTTDPALTVLVRPDRVIAAAGTRSRLPRLPWPIPAAAGPERPATVPPAAHPESASPATATP